MGDRIKLLAIMAICVSVAGCGPERPAGRDEYVGVVHPSVLAKAGLRHYWTIRAALDPDERIVKLHRLDETLYCQTDKNRLVAVDALRGLHRWAVEVGDVAETVFRPCHQDQIVLPKKPAGIAEMMHPGRAEKTEPFDALFVNTVHYVLVIDRATGSVVRKIDLPYAAGSGGCSDGELYFWADINGLYHALALREEVQLWSFSTEGMVTAPVECMGSAIYVASHDKHFYCARASRIRKRLWRQLLDGPVSAPFHVGTRFCFVPCEDGRLYGFDAVSGLQLWEPFTCQGPLRRAPQVSKSTVFQYAQNDAFYAVDLVKGELRWRKPHVRRVLASMDANAYLLDARRNLLVVDETIGEVKASLGMVGFDLFLPNTRAPAIYTATVTGRLFCIRPIAAGHLTLDMLHPGAGKVKKPAPKTPAPPAPKKPAPAPPAPKTPAPPAPGPPTP